MSPTSKVSAIPATETLNGCTLPLAVLHLISPFLHPSFVGVTEKFLQSLLPLLRCEDRKVRYLAAESRITIGKGTAMRALFYAATRYLQELLTRLKITLPMLIAPLVCIAVGSNTFSVSRTIASTPCNSPTAIPSP